MTGWRDICGHGHGHGDAMGLEMGMDGIHKHGACADFVALLVGALGEIIILFVGVDGMVCIIACEPCVRPSGESASFV